MHTKVWHFSPTPSPVNYKSKLFFHWGFLFRVTFSPSALTPIWPKKCLLNVELSMFNASLFDAHILPDWGFITFFHNCSHCIWSVWLLYLYSLCQDMLMHTGLVSLPKNFWRRDARSQDDQFSKKTLERRTQGEILKLRLNVWKDSVAAIVGAAAAAGVLSCWPGARLGRAPRGRGKWEGGSRKGRQGFRNGVKSPTG